MIDWLLDTSLWPARWDCGGWSPSLGYGTITANVEIALAYFTIPFLGVWMLRRKPFLAPDLKLAYWFLAFVMLCGTTHLLDALNFYWPAYRLNYLIRQATAVVSLWTMYLLFRSRKRFLLYKSPEEYRIIVMQRDDALAAKDAMIAAKDVERAAISREAATLHDKLREVEHRIRNDEWVADLHARIAKLGQSRTVQGEADDSSYR